MLKRVMRWRRFLYRKTITIAFFQWQSSLQPTKIFTFHAVTQLEPNLFFVLFCCSIFSFWLSSESCFRAWCVYAWNAIIHTSRISAHVLNLLLIRHFQMLSKLILFACLFVAFCFSILSFSTAGNIRQWTIHSCTQLSCLKGKRNEFDSIAKYFKSTELRFIPNESIRKIKPNS